MTQDEAARWISGLIAGDRLHDFYASPEWERLRLAVLTEHKFECQQCRARGFYKRADTVHHVQFVRKHPGLALSRMYIFDGREYQNLVPLCHDCHERVHDYRKRAQRAPLTPERW